MEQGLQQDLSQSKMGKRLHKYLLVIAILVMVFASGLVGYLIGVRIGERAMNQIVSQPIHAPIPSLPTEIPTQHPTTMLSPMPTIDTNIAYWQTYTLQTIGLEFKLPTEGDINTHQLTEHVLTAANGGLLSGSVYTAAITQPQYAITVQADSTDSSAGRSALFTDLVGYSVTNGQYATKYHSSDGFRTVAIPKENIIGETTNPYGVHILKIKNTPDTITNFIFMNASVGALINTSNPTYPGIVFQVDSGNLDEKVFDQILTTFRFIH